MTFYRRDLLSAASGAVAGLAGCSAASPITDSTGGTAKQTAVSLETIASGLRSPLAIEFAPDGNRRYIAEQLGLVRVHEDGLREQPLLDLRETVVTGSETGLLGIALHPEFVENRRLFVRYSAPPRNGTPRNDSHTFVLSEFRVTDDGRRVRPDSERTVLEIPQPQRNHNAGSIVFGPNGYLFVGVGDGGGGGDQGEGHASDWYDSVAGGNGQDVTENMLGSILRIDVDGRDGETEYAIPADNPLVGREGLDEQFAWGFRNPWQLSVDQGALYAGDVGQNRYEGIDHVISGGNYGWNVKEGRHCYQADDCPDTTPETVRGGEPLRDPVVEYPHTDEPVSGISVIIGNVYRGTAVPELHGSFVFADYRAQGRLFLADPGDGQWPTAVLPIVSGDAGKLEQVLSMGRDADGEMYVLGSGEDGGGVYRLEAAG
jgi:glucose/arabinose dehydrogenase